MDTATDDPLAIAEPYSFAAELVELWPSGWPPRGSTVEPWQIGVTAYVRPTPAGQSATTAAGIRADLLAQGEAVIAAYGEAGWLLDGAPRFGFDGSLRHTRTAITGQVMEMPAEYGIKLTLGLTLARTVKPS